MITIYRIRTRILILFPLLTAALFISQAFAVSFQNVTSEAGINHSSQSFGCSWGDLNSDGIPDIYISNHWLTPNLYLNNGVGGFWDVASTHDVLLGHIDVHGAAWGDYDNDGDQDLVTAVGGTASGGGSPDTPFFINEYGSLRLHDSSATGLSHGHHDRTPTWIDEDLDGDLDLIMASKIKEPENYSALMLQSDGYFKNHAGELGLADMGAEWAVPILLGDPHMFNRQILFNSGVLFNKVEGIWEDVTADVFPANSHFIGVDYAHGDVNGDGYFDLYAIREGNREQVKFSEGKVEISTITFADLLPSELPFVEFEHQGSLRINYGLSLAPKRFHLGVSAIPYSGSGLIQLSSDDPALVGEPNFFIPNDTQAHVYIWYVPEFGVWRMKFGSNILRRKIELLIESTSPMQNPVLANITADDLGATNYLFLGGADGKFVRDETTAIQFRGKSRSGAFADLDNDMDLDLYIVNRNLFDNPANQLFENLGGGQFVEVPNAGGASGTSFGSGDSVSVADYDLDGYLDLFIVNGTTDLRVDSYEGPQQLFKNSGGSNEWLQVDLIGTNSNRDGNGALVEVIDGGVKQLRYHDGGVHRYSQHFNRLHFGMGQQRYADEVVVTWPNGDIETFTQVPTGQILEIYEQERDFLSGVPVINPDKSGLYIYKLTYDGPYYFEFNGGPNADIFELEVLTDAAVTGLRGDGLNPGSVSNHYFSGVFQNDLVQFELLDSKVSLVRLTQAGNPEFRHVYFGSTQVHPQPAGWIMDFEALAEPPGFFSGVDLGTFVGVYRPSNILSVKFNGDGKLHKFEADILGDNTWQDSLALLFEAEGDSLTLAGNRASISATVAGGWDGAKLFTDTMSKIGIYLRQDSFLQTKYINFRSTKFNRHNAFLLPKPSATGKPSYDPGVNPALYVWLDELTHIWHVRVTGGGTTNPWAQFKGTLKLSQDASALQYFLLEGNDTVIQHGPRDIEFHLLVMKSGEDGIDIIASEGTTLTLDLESGGNLVTTVYIGKHLWEVEKFPVLISVD